MQRAYFLLLIIGFFQPVLAWEVNLANNNQITVSNNRPIDQVDVYLVWVDLDNEPEQQFLSWEFERGWDIGLKPIVSTTVDLPEFESYAIDFETKTCPESHRCLLAFVATPHNKSPLASQSNWQASSFLPLSTTAACERLPRQKIFLFCNEQSNFDKVSIMVSGMADEDVIPPTAAAPNADMAIEEEPSTNTETEKPDIFKLVDNTLLYANGQAKRFQAIDLSDLSNPELAGWIALHGNPREVYALEDYYVLLQTNYGGENSTHLTVIQQDENSALNIIQEISLAGQFIESRRRGDFIYVVMGQSEMVDVVCAINEFCLDYTLQTLNINVLQLTETGKLENVDKNKKQILGYSPNIAIFPDYLVISNRNLKEGGWLSTQIQVFDLSQTDPLVALPTLIVPGQVPSEFHLNIQNQQLRVVYGPENRQAGSTLGIYNLNSPELALIGEVSDIAPGEDLFATRFANNRAFVVTYERQDPLWVIDLTDSEKPTILGELHIPGWSEKMFFHDDILFAVGIHDQPLENEAIKFGVRRVALSLFDVADPTNPTLLDRFVPLADRVQYSQSPALYDERALLLDWENEFAALPILSHENGMSSHLQLTSFANRQFENVGVLDSPILIQRSLKIAPDVLVALGDQALTTLRWGNGQTKVLGELELATNLSWLKVENNTLWAAAMGNQGYYRFYQYSLSDLETPLQSWSLPTNYNNVEMAGNLAVFYGNYPLTMQALNLDTGEFYPALTLENNSGVPIPEIMFGTNLIAVEDSIFTDDIWYQRTQPLLHNGWVYVGEQRPLDVVSTLSSIMPDFEKENWQTQWMLRGWNIANSAEKITILYLPGEPIAFTNNGQIITREIGGNKQLRLNLSKIEGDTVRLLDNYLLDCQAYSNIIWSDNSLYVDCTKEEFYGPIYYDVVDEGIKAPEPEEVVEPTTRLIKLQADQTITEVGSWELEGSRNLIAASSDIVLLNYNNWYYPKPWLDNIDLMIEPPITNIASSPMIPPISEQNGCDIYQLIADAEPLLLKHLEESCPYGIALTASQAWIAEGFAGIKHITW